MLLSSDLERKFFLGVRIAVLILRLGTKILPKCQDYFFLTNHLEIPLNPTNSIKGSTNLYDYPPNPNKPHIKCLQIVGITLLILTIFSVSLPICQNYTFNPNKSSKSYLNL